MANLIYKNLLRKNVKDVFLYSGGAIMPLVDKFYQSPIKYYINTNENNLGYSAVGYAKSSLDTPGIAIVTSGPGITNMTTAITDAQSDSTPMIVLSGQVSTEVINTGAFQECPALDITRSITKWSCQPRSLSELNYAINKAFHISTNGKPGVVHIDLCKDILLQEDNYDLDADYRQLTYVDLLPAVKHIDYANIIDIINEAERPIIIAGKGAIQYAYEVRKFVNTTKIPLTTTIHAMGIINEDHPLVLPFMGMHGSPASNYVVQESDCIINLGSRFDDRILGDPNKFAPYAKIIHCNISKCDLGKTLPKTRKHYYPVHDDVKSFITHIIQAIKPRYYSGWHTKISDYKKIYTFKYNKAPRPLIKTQDVIVELNKQINHRNTIITSGVGNHQMMAAQFIDWEYPNKFITSGSLGVMGVGLPYAIGVQLANPTSMVIDIDGDGSFNQTFTDLKLLKDYNLPIKIIIMDDGELSMVKVWEELFYNSRHVATKLTNNPNYAALANAFGIESLYCDNIDNLPTTIKKMLNTRLDKPILVHVKVQSDKCLPLVPPGKSLSEMIMI